MRPVPPPPLLSPLPSSSPEEDEDGGDDDASTDGCDIKTEAPAEVEDSELWDNGESAVLVPWNAVSRGLLVRNFQCFHVIIYGVVDVVCFCNSL